MGQSKWNEDKIIQTLKDFPKMKDRQSKEELYEKMEQKRSRSKPKQRRLRFMPVLAAACVLFIAAIISPAILKDTVLSPPPGEEAGVENHGSTDHEQSSLKKADEPQQAETLLAPESDPLSTENTIETRSYEGDMVFYPGVQDVPAGKQVVTLYYPDSEAMGTVPLSTFVDKSLTRVESINTALNKIQPEKYGVSENIILALKDIKLTEVQEENALVVDLAPNSVQGSTGVQMFLETIQYTAYESGYDIIKLQTNGVAGYDLPHMGSYKQLDVEAPEKGVSALLSENGTYLLTNGIKLNGENKPESLEEALQLMKQNNDGFGYHETIQRNVFIKKVSENGTTAVIEFSKGSEFKENLLYQAMIESMLLTAEQFGYENVQFVNTNFERIGPYNLTEPITVLKAPNVVTP
ncbi:hypothetical protein [Alkalihalobacillus sp. AL-G]|uniref:hypothetical protein n=1 Tax=Alkalihalobacillus sp. AL-G TaxID=2926399 RepID=UPI00272CA90A|nr:hypothetical protein [Alkalihalobacillus sp. AL-G]WLD93642.1 hypothetical protein MOJ78_01500 [Alkalihalobacillus sp. AL-G]